MTDTTPPPLTIALPDLLEDGQDRRFRDFVADLFAAAAAMQSLRRAIGRAAGLGGNELAVMLAVARLLPEGPVGVRAVADHLHLAPSNVTAEVNALVRRGLLEKAASRADSRAVELRPTPDGAALLARLAPRLREVNAALFGMLSRERLTELRGFFGALLDRVPGALAAAAAPIPAPPAAAPRAPRTRGRSR